MPLAASRNRTGPEEADIFDAQLLFLEDPDLLARVDGAVPNRREHWKVEPAGQTRPFTGQP